MNSTAVRQFSPLLRTPNRSLLPLWRRSTPPRPFSVGHQLRAEDGTKRPRAPKRNRESPSLFEELFPDEDLSSPMYKGKGSHNSETTAAAKADSSGEAPKVKVRFLTSSEVDKSEAMEYKRKVLESKRQAEREAPAKVADLLGSRPRKDNGDATVMDEGGSSLFNELFSSKDPDATGSQAGGQLFEDTPVDHNDLQSWLDSLPKEDADSGAPERSAMLVLSNASTNLLESDFYRIGPQGHHLDGWSASIRKVMQAYDYSNLEPMDRYFILFDSYDAAASYQKEAQRLHALARRSLLSPAAGLNPNPSTTVFTLAPPSNAPLSLHLYKLDRAAENRLETFSIHGLLSMTPEPPPRANSQVILSLDGGALDQRTMSTWIKRDARDRNLGWPVQHMRPYFAPKVHRRQVTAEEPAEDDDHGWNGDTPPSWVVDADERDGLTEETTLSARFVLSFPDAHEARRFVRAWHRKELVTPGAQSLIVNTHFVW
ncbi:hypothetical protein CCHL11_00505 [Colletotrichum chlorophyti]|uniref:Uncharacterized protein n=1 Tax=Colletotrichum chlorophyti TaxID=708187 RepID=A0A1Q8RUN5_9PEZI|nr:hypothetical protein CCHL11_00505 [Colletotrichum chlorophyti]